MPGAAGCGHFGKSDRAGYKDRRSAVDRHKLCRAHNSAITGSRDHAVRPTSATVAFHEQAVRPQLVKALVGEL